MAEAKVIDALGKVVDSAQLEGKLFNSEAKPHLLHEYIVGYQRNQRQGNAATKTRTMVRGGGKKPWRQKGTGRARSGSNTSPVWVGGGIVWGPHPKSYYSPLPKKFKQSALKSAFSDKAASGCLRIVDLPELEKPRTHTVVDFLKSQDIYHSRVLILLEAANDNFAKSCRNIKWLEVKRSILVNPFDLVWAEFVLMTRDALQKIKEVFDK